MKKFRSIGNFKTAYDFRETNNKSSQDIQEMDSKSNRDVQQKLKGRRGDGKPKVRKEDISNPVNFRHVDGYAMNKEGVRKGSMSACTSPTTNGQEFFNSISVPNGNDNSSNRLSDPSSSHTNLFSHGKENAFERYQQFKDEEQFHTYDSSRSSFGADNTSEQVMRRSKNSGSLRNLTFLQFAKQASNPRDISPKSKKRVSLGSLLPSARNSYTPAETFYPPPPTNQPPSPIYETEQGPLTRRRSSSFNGDSDIVAFRLNHQQRNNDISSVVATAPVRENADNPRSSIFNWKKKPKFSGPVVPPVSPTYDQLPPPPLQSNEIYDIPRLSTELPLPECPSYSDLPPPPPPASEEATLVYRRGFTGSPLTISHDEELPPPPLSASSVQTANNDEESESNTGTVKRRPKLPPPNPRALPASSSAEVSTLERKVPGWRSRVVKVNAPTIPPSSAPFVKTPCKEGSPITPDSWPLAPSFPSVQEGHYEEIDHYPPPPPQSDSNSTLETTEFSSLPNMSFSSQPQPVESNKVDRNHLKPLSRLLQRRIPVHLWPVVMTQLFSSCAIPEDSDSNQTCNESAAYTELITKTLELLIEMKDGDVSYEEVISAFEKTQYFAENVKD